MITVLLSACSGGGIPNQQPDPDPQQPVDPGPPIVQIAGTFTSHDSLPFPILRKYFLACRRLSDDRVVASVIMPSTSLVSVDFDFKNLYLDTYRIQVLSYEIIASEVTFRIEWTSVDLHATMAKPVFIELQYEVDQDFGARYLAYELYLSGSQEPDYLFYGIRLEGAPDSDIYSWWPEAWDSVLAFIDPPWDGALLDFNNDGKTPEWAYRVPEGSYIIGVYAIDPTRPNELIVYGESAEPVVTTEVAPSSGTALYIDFDHPVIRQLD